MGDYSFQKGLFSEEALENAIIELFGEQGIPHTKGEEIHRTYDEIIIRDDLIAFITERHATLSEKELNTVVNKITKPSSNSTLYRKNKDAYYLLSEGFDLKRDNPKATPIHIDFLNFDNPEKNIFKVVNQYSVKGPQETRRPDLLLFINGIPVAIFEFKTAIEEDTTIHDAWEQINIRYTRDIENLMQYCCLSVISDGANNRLGTIFTPYEFYYSWNKVNNEEKVSNGISSLITLIKGAFSKERILSIIQNYIYYPESDDKEMEIVCRYPQFFGAQLMAESVKEHLKPNGDGKGGTYFGATGCGKTYTMLFMSKIITQRYSDVFKNPTIIVITDRDDLNSQTEEVFVKAKRFLHENDIRAFDSRDDLGKTLKNKESGGIYVTTIQKFCEKTGLLSKRSNIICISDEAHRTQTNIGESLNITAEGVAPSYGFAQYLRWALPNATYCGFTGTPIDETIAVFGPIVDKYTMKESSDDGITVRISYEPRLARVIVSEDLLKKIEDYYKLCEDEGATPEQINESKKAMSSIEEIIGNPGVIKKLAADIVEHYDALRAQKPAIVQKGMIVCSNRQTALLLYKEITDLRRSWKEPKKAEDESDLTQAELDKLDKVPFINMVATQGPNDEKELYDICGTKEHRKKLDRLFKNDKSNFHLAVVVDMWITGFDVPSLSVMYINKPLQRHTLIQTISRVNRVFEGKDCGLVVDYIGFKQNMMKALKIYGDPEDSPFSELNISVEIFRNHLSLINDLVDGFDPSLFFTGTPLQRLLCLNDGAEFVQRNKDVQTRFMSLTKRLKAAFEICFPSGELTDEETTKAQYYLAIRSIIYKQTIGNVPDAEVMNSKVTSMVEEALKCTGVEDIVDEHKDIDIFSDEFMKELEKIKMPISKFNALVKLLKQAISAYSKSNKVKAYEFSEMLKKVVEKYNSRDKLVFTSEVVADFVDGLSGELIGILHKLKEDQESFKKLGISFEEKAFYDILIKVRDTRHFVYSDEKCVKLAKAIKALVDDKSQYADWNIKSDIKNQLNMDLTVLLYENGYPPEWDEEVFEKVMEQAENFKKYR